jgi:hypothetical protein
MMAIDRSNRLMSSFPRQAAPLTGLVVWLPAYAILW